MKFVNTALFLRLGLLSTLICHENRTFGKRSSNWRNLKGLGLGLRDSEVDVSSESLEGFVVGAINSASESLYGGHFTLSTQLIKPNYRNYQSWGKGNSGKCCGEAENLSSGALPVCVNKLGDLGKPEIDSKYDGQTWDSCWSFQASQSLTNSWMNCTSMAKTLKMSAFSRQ